MPRGEGQIDDRIRVLFVNTKRQPPLGADTWVHLQIMRELDRSRVEVHAACVDGSSEPPDADLSSGCERSPTSRSWTSTSAARCAGGSLASKVLAVLSLIPAAWSVLRLAWYIRRHGIELIHTADRPRDAAVAVLLSRITRRSASCTSTSASTPTGCEARCSARSAGADARIAISDFVADTLRDGGLRPGVDLRRAERHRARRDGSPGAGARPSDGSSRSTTRHPSSSPSAVSSAPRASSELVQAMHDVTRRGSRPRCSSSSARRWKRATSTSCEPWSRDYDLDDRVRFLGRRDDVPALMAAADVFAMPSAVRAVRLGLRRGHGDGAAGRRARQRRHGRSRRAGRDRPAVAARATATRSPPTSALSCSTLSTRAAYGAARTPSVSSGCSPRQRMADDTADVFADRARSSRKIGPVALVPSSRNRRRWSPHRSGHAGHLGR